MSSFLPTHKKETKPLQKLVVILGPTAAGKTDWSLELAKKYNGEIISADSRQIYKDMDIGTAKTPGEWRRNGLRRTYYVNDIPHHLIDFLNPGKTFTVAEFRDRAIKYVKLAARHKKLPMLVGGTGLYISSVVDNFNIPRVPANKKLRGSLEEKTCEQLMALLETMDPETAQRIDPKNKRRIIRALEVCILTGESFSKQQKKGDQLFDVLQIGVATPRETLYTRIEQRVDMMVKRGLVKEIEILLKRRYSWELPSMSGVGYRQFRDYFDEKITLERAIELLKRDTKRFARRQLTWFRRDKRIHWCDNLEQADALIKDFLS